MVTIEVDGGTLLLFLLAQSIVIVGAAWGFSLSISNRISRLEGHMQSCPMLDFGERRKNERAQEL